MKKKNNFINYRELSTGLSTSYFNIVANLECD